MTQADMMDVSIRGQKVGVLDVPTYTGGKTADGMSATAKIAANFTKAGITLVGQALLGLNAIKGTTFMQTVMFMTDKQQKIFRNGTGGNLVGTFSDPPQGGYTLPDGSKAFADDKTPWYSTIQPSGTRGDIPPKSFGANQFFDMPTLPFGVINGIDGLAGVLNGKDGMLKFETALVAVKVCPTDDPATAEDERLTKPYTVVVLKGFMWGLNFKFVDDGMDGITAADYQVTKKDLMFETDVSNAFKGAFDKAGDNADIEWKVNFVESMPEPSSLTLVGIGVIVLGITQRRISKRREVQCSKAS